MAHHKHDFSSSNFASEFQASKDVGRFYVAGHSSIEDIADSEIHDHLGWRARVDTAEQGCFWLLSLRARFLLSQVVAILPFAAAKPSISILHRFNDLLRHKVIALLLCQGSGKSIFCQEHTTTEGGRRASK